MPTKEDIALQGKHIYFPNLDGFRSIAFLMVFFAHCFILFDFGKVTGVTNILLKLFGLANTGVNFFFVLSGFLISYLILSENEKFGKINIKAFYIRRILRIWPVYFAVVFISLLLSFINKPFYDLHNASFWMIGTFFTNFNLAGQGISSLPLTVLWSVAVEEQFYLLLPILILLFSKRVFLAFPLFIIASLIFRFIFRHNIMYVEFHTISVCSSLFVGCLCAYLALFKGLSKLFAGIPRIAIIAVYAAFFAMHLFRDKIFSFRGTTIWLYLIYSLFFAFFILEQNYSENSFFKMSRFRLLTSIGKYTYGLYAYHMIFITLLMVFIPEYTNPQGNYLVYFSLWTAALLFSFIFAKLSYNYMEKPFLQLKEKFSR
jgi:peptidoglycan/LPS O-acetylase OafA/YrhL